MCASAKPRWATFRGSRELDGIRLFFEFVGQVFQLPAAFLDLVLVAIEQPQEIDHAHVFVPVAVDEHDGAGAGLLVLGEPRVGALGAPPGPPPLEIR